MYYFFLFMNETTDKTKGSSNQEMKIEIENNYCTTYIKTKERNVGVGVVIVSQMMLITQLW